MLAPGHLWLNKKAVAKFLGNKKAIESYLVHFKNGLEERLRGIHAGFMKLKKEGLPVDCITPEAAIYLTIKVDAVGKKTADGKLLETQADVTAYMLNEAGLAVDFFALLNKIGFVVYW